MQQPVWKRLLWLAIIWGGSVLALAAVSIKLHSGQPCAARHHPALSDKPH